MRCRLFAGTTALWLACLMGYGEITRMLLDAGCDPTIASDDGTTPLVVAARNGRAGCLHLLQVGSRDGSEGHLLVFSPLLLSFGLEMGGRGRGVLQDQATPRGDCL